MVEEMVRRPDKSGQIARRSWGGAGERGRSSSQGERAPKLAKKSWSDRPGQIDTVLLPWTGQHMIL